jgi:prepilin-type N-terminal cleavage/methylation domain-containing protein
MLKKLQKSKDQKGFTIIEVLIVLAIAGLIMVVVFLAVPALQRSGRNNALNTDANNILASVGDYSTNNGGTLPVAQAATAPAGGFVTIGTAAAGVNVEKAKVDGSTTSMQIDAAALGAASLTATAANQGKIEVVIGVNGSCNATGTQLSSTPASARSYAVVYVAESGSGPILKCQGS